MKFSTVKEFFHCQGNFPKIIKFFKKKISFTKEIFIKHGSFSQKKTFPQTKIFTQLKIFSVSKDNIK